MLLYKEMARVTGCPLSYLLERGQAIKAVENPVGFNLQDFALLHLRRSRHSCFVKLE